MTRSQCNSEITATGQRMTENPLLSPTASSDLLPILANATFLRPCFQPAHNLKVLPNNSTDTNTGVKVRCPFSPHIFSDNIITQGNQGLFHLIILRRGMCYHLPTVSSSCLHKMKQIYTKRISGHKFDNRNGNVQKSAGECPLFQDTVLLTWKMWFKGMLQCETAESV